MRTLPFAVFALVCGLGLGASHVAQAKEKWVCMKEGTEIKVKGKKPKDKEKDCTSQGGTWEKAQHDHEKQESGTGGSW